MSKISDYEAQRVLEFFKTSPESERKLISIAKTITKNTLTHLAFNDASKIVFLHSESVSSILNRKPISKEMLYKYLTDNNIPVTSNFTKTTLVDQVIEYWRRGESQGVNEDRRQTTETAVIDKQHFPINVMAKNFTSWFFKNLNENMIQIQDFWSDVTCTVKMVDNADNVKEDSTITSHHVLGLLLTTKSQFNFYFNPNCSYEGTRGKMEHHGIVLILSCGTVHTQASVIAGLFESVFTLMRDPFTDNNWKIKNINLKIQSTPAIGIQKLMPQLESCPSLQPLMMLPESEECL